MSYKCAITDAHDQRFEQDARSTPVIIQNRDGSLVREWEPEHTPVARQRVYAEVEAPVLQQQASLIERLIAFAFDTIGVRHVEVRVLDTE
jgi:hypothetical protein